MKNKRVIFFLVIIFIAFIIVNIVYSISLSSKIATLPTGIYTDEVSGFKMNYAPKWVAEIPDRNVLLQLRNQSSNCTVSYGKIDTKKLSSGYNGGLGEAPDGTGPVFYEFKDNDVYLGSKHLKLYSFWQRPQFYYEGAGYRVVGAYIDNFPSKNSLNNLVLYASGSVMNDSCISDFLDLLNNGTTFKDSLYSLSSNSNGTIEGRVSFLSIGIGPGWDKAKTVLVFKDQNGNEKVMAYLDKSDPSVSQLELVGNDLYFINGTGELSVLDLQSKQVSIVSLPAIAKVEEQKPSQINDFLIVSDALYYLAGENCNAYMAHCDLTLHRYDLVNKNDVTLATGLTLRSILGYDSETNKIYMEESFGDGGSASFTLKAYDFAAGKVVAVASAIYAGDEGLTNPAEYQKIKAIETKLKNQVGRLSNITVLNGVINKSQTISTSTNYVMGNMQIRYVQ